VHPRECENLTKPSASGDLLRRVADYAAGYADAQAERVRDESGSEL
jgi:hypothetical protein